MPMKMKRLSLYVDYNGHVQCTVEFEDKDYAAQEVKITLGNEIAQKIAELCVNEVAATIYSAVTKDLALLGTTPAIEHDNGDDDPGEPDTSTSDTEN